MHKKAILTILVGIMVIGISQFTFAEEPHEKGAYIAVDVAEFDQPQTRYSFQGITITGYVPDYFRGQTVIITIINPSGSEEEINTFASKKGNMYTLLHITHDSQIGVHQVILKYLDKELASTSFEILEK
jgi:hypothetical protein